MKIDDCLARYPSELGDCGSTMRSRKHFVALDCVRRLDRIVRSSGDPPASARRSCVAGRHDGADGGDGQRRGGIGAKGDAEAAWIV